MSAQAFFVSSVSYKNIILQQLNQFTFDFGTSHISIQIKQVHFYCEKKLSCKVNNDWFELEFEMKDKSKVKYREFLKKENDFALKCSPCDSTINVKSKGFAAVTQHLKRNKHIENMEIKFNKNQSKIEVSNTSKSTA